MQGAVHICNLYNLTTNQQAIRDLVRITRDSIGNLEPSIDVYPDRPAPVIRNTENGPELARLTWGMPTPPQFLKAPGAPDTGVTNIRNTSSPHWRRWLGVESRCVVPATAFSEYGQQPDPVTRRKPLHWFALDETQPVFFFAGIWTTWHGTRGSNRTPREGRHELFAFLTTEPNGVVEPIHPKAMPVILTTQDEVEIWLSADWSDAKLLQRPLPDALLSEVAR
ncbi:SOS response-associated peptidase [Paracoccus aeridis]|uniref:SOS response-associated peptidase n=1 Tax=Paracoccus aeridis TaxID=1966466 RepID=UPI001F28803B|nr:SOS response-associated peptidase [Paracoccus aeridis]